MLHTGSSFPDELDEDAPIYHYPNTDRPPARDDNEIRALKNSKADQVPVFVIVRPTPSSTVRDVEFGWVEDWNDETREFLIALDLEEPPPTAPTPIDEEPFQLTTQRASSTAEQTTRPGQARFRFEVFERYGAKCAVCEISIKELLDAVHIKPFSKNGTDDPRNGLVMCANHHRCFDNAHFTINPTTLKVEFNIPKHIVRELGFTRDSIEHLEFGPADDALKWHFSEHQD
jgi:putative restriction endonuclease